MNCFWDSLKGSGGQCRPNSGGALASCNAGDVAGASDLVDENDCLTITNEYDCTRTTDETHYQSCMSLELS